MRSRYRQPVQRPPGAPTLLATAVALSLSMPMFAATAAETEDAQAAAEPGQHRAVQLDSVVVTAERREVDLQQAPLAVSSISSETLEQGNITDITGLNGLVPGLVVAKSGGAERIIAIRGIGSETPENTNTQPGVSLHVDGIYIFNPIAANAAFIDTDRVEVLRGPQGTMFGQGSTGGTINVVSRQPELGVLGGEISAGLGNYDLSRSHAALNIPVGETFALRGAVQHDRHDGYAKLTDVYGEYGYEADQSDDIGGKLAALWAPTEDISLTLSAITYKGDTNAPAQKNILDPEPDPRVLSQDYPGKSLVETDLYSAVFQWDLPGVTFKSLTGYQTLYSEQSWDADALTAPLFYDVTYHPLLWGGTNYDHVALWRSDVDSWSQEFNLSSNGDGPFQWIAGAVYLRSENSQYIVEYRDSDLNLITPPLPEDSPWNDPAVGSVAYAELSSIKRESWAAYFQGTYAFNDRLSLTAGLRYNHDDYSGTSASVSGGDTSATSGAYLQPSPTEGLTTEEVTGKLALDYQFTPSSMGYASYTRGYKPGGINGAASGGNSWSIPPTFRPETINAFEIGSKNRFLDNTLQLNVAAFLYDYRNLQFLEEDPILYGEGTSNAPSAEIYGLEVEGSWLASRNWRFDGSLSALRGEFDEDYYALDPALAEAAQIAAGYPGWLFWSNFYPATLARDAARQNIRGNDVPKLPELQGALSATYTNELFGGLVTAKAEYLYRGKFQYRLFNEGFYDTVPSYDVVNLFFRYQPDDSNWYGSLTVSNLFDEDGINSRFSDPYGSAQTTETYIAPRQWIVTVGYRF